MKVIIITQDDPFYIPENIDYLVSHFPYHSEVIGCCVFDVSPFGKKESFFVKSLRAMKVFGLEFFVYYSFRYVFRKLILGKSVVEVLRKHKVPVIDIKGSINSKESIGLLNAYAPDLLISIAGNQIFKRSLIDLAPEGCLNLHTALLPKYRGLMPSFWVLKNGERETGVSVFFVDEGIDSGPIIVQERIMIGDRTQEQLIRYTKRVGMDAIIKAVDLIEHGKYKLLENRGEEKTYFSFPKREDVKDFLRSGKRFF